ncbi:MAG TPA: glutathione S-transferase family protein [Rhizomicrobium sp.]|jgi:glutathione S-transferase|nr:glutathione S-transferase family protein [Rhizomicrobium sp.]
MRRLIHLTLSPPSRVARLILGEKRLTFDPVGAEDSQAHLPIFVELDGARSEGLWAVIDHLEGTYADHPLVPEDAIQRGEVLRWLDWTMGQMNERTTRKILYEKAAPRYTGAPSSGAPDMNNVRQGREALRAALPIIGKAAEQNGNLVLRDCTLADLAVAAHLSALDYFGEVPWSEFPQAAEWYVRMKSRPSFRSLLADRLPGQPPVMHYAELDF